VKDGVKESQLTDKGKLEKVIDVAMRDGTMLKADLFRLDSDEKCPVILNMGIHQKGDYNDGDNTLYSGGDKESCRLLPIIPAT
jgi:predicted acyl esterase